MKISSAGFEEFGTVPEALEDGTPFTAQEAMLDVSRGTPRFYLTRLHRNPPRFRGITRHIQTTQCLISVAGASRVIAVAPPADLEARPRRRGWKTSGRSLSPVTSPC